MTIINKHTRKATGLPPAVVPYSEQFAALQNLRRAIEASLESMIDALDRIDAQTEDMESGGDDEPYLAGFGGFGRDLTQDLELDEAESGVADADGVFEQFGYIPSVPMVAR